MATHRSVLGNTSFEEFAATLDAEVANLKEHYSALVYTNDMRAH